MEVVLYPSTLCYPEFLSPQCDDYSGVRVLRGFWGQEKDYLNQSRSIVGIKQRPLFRVAV